MGILETPEPEKTPVSTKRKSSGPDFSNLGPLNKFGTVGFSGYRDNASAKKKSKDKAANVDAMDSDAEDNDDGPSMEQDDETDAKQENGKMLSPEDARNVLGFFSPLLADYIVARLLLAGVVSFQGPAPQRFTSQLSFIFA